MSNILDPQAIIALHKERVDCWKSKGLTYDYQGFLQLVEQNHAFNYQLWNTEDKARRDDMGFEWVYKAKRDIDGFNQQRNNRMEAMDEYLFNALKPEQPGLVPVNSESPGMMIDRLSILALKAYHMELQTKRAEVDEAHRATCAIKLEVIHQQLNQLASCLAELFEAVLAKKRTFRVYHQFKMYNDPTLNPELY